MGRKNYSEEFRRRAVDLFESTPGATFKAIAADLGIERNTLSQWVTLYGTGKRTTLDGNLVKDHRAAGPHRDTLPSAAETPEARIARLEVENARLRAETTKLRSEREILRQAAKYFAGETNW